MSSTSLELRRVSSASYRKDGFRISFVGLAIKVKAAARYLETRRGELELILNQLGVIVDLTARESICSA